MKYDLKVNEEKLQLEIVGMPKDIREFHEAIISVIHTKQLERRVARMKEEKETQLELFPHQ